MKVQASLKEAGLKELKRLQRLAQWDKNYLAFAEWRKNNRNRIPTNYMTDPTARRLGIWYQAMRIRIREKPEYAFWKKRFEELGIDFFSNEEKWERNYLSLNEYISKQGHLPDSQHFLYRWLRTQPQKWKELSSHQQQMIQQLPTAGDEKAAAWEKGFKEFETFYLQHQRFPSRIENPPLLRWWAKQRVALQKGKIEPNQLKLLQQLTGLPTLTRRRAQSWQHHFNELKKWRSAHPGQWPTYNSSGVERPLAVWCMSQRQIYFRTLKNFLPMPPDRIRKLDGIGFPWRSDRALAGINPRRWEKRYAQLKQYVKKQGLKGELTLKPNNSLYQWWQTQKLCFKNNTLRHYRLQKIKQLGILLK